MKITFTELINTTYTKENRPSRALISMLTTTTSLGTPRNIFPSNHSSISISWSPASSFKTSQSPQTSVVTFFHSFDCMTNSSQSRPRHPTYHQQNPPSRTAVQLFLGSFTNITFSRHGDFVEKHQADINHDSLPTIYLNHTEQSSCSALHCDQQRHMSPPTSFPTARVPGIATWLPKERFTLSLRHLLHRGINIITLNPMHRTPLPVTPTRSS